MAALTVDGEVAPAAAREQARRAQAGARAEHGQRHARLRAATPDLAQVGGMQSRQRQRQRGEVVDHLQTPQPELLAQLGNRERPMVVGHLHVVTDDRVGDPDGAFGRYLIAGFCQVVADRRQQRIMLRTGVAGYVARRGAGMGLPGEAGVGAADVIEQGERGCGAWCLP